MKFLYSLLISSFCLAGCTSTKNLAQQTSQLAAKDLLPYGRTRFTDKGLELISSASHFSFSFTGRECKIYVSISGQERNYVQYEMDGMYQKRARVNIGSTEPLVITANDAGKHSVKIYKATEAHTGPVFIEKIEGKEVKPLKNSSQPLIEFIGNSITCGAAADDAEVPCGTGSYHDQHNAYYAYGSRVARALHTNFILSSVSGIGIYRNWNSNGPTMPQVYEKTDFLQSGLDSWNFSSYQPKIVSIALGTNDFSKGALDKPRPPFDSASFVSNYIQFVQLVKTKYPDVQIALLSSAIINGQQRILLQNCLTAVKSSVDVLYPSDKPVALYFFKPMQARGCTGHPSVDDHGILAEELIPFFKSLL